MHEDLDLILYKMRFLIAGLLVVVSVILASFILSALGPDTSVKAAEPHHAASFSSMNMSDGPNVVANGMGAIAYNANRATTSVEQATYGGLHAVAQASIRSGAFITSGVRGAGSFIGGGIASTAHAVGSGIAFAGRSVASGVVFVVRIPVNLAGFVTDSAPVSAVIKPADHDPVPVIDPNSPALFAAQKSMAEDKPAKKGVSDASTKAMWPIHGAITTEFGVPEPPYQPIHTGLDISDGKAPGITPIHPFKPGRVIAVVHSGGLGNHVIVDHGHGVTSVYGHMYSTAVHVGQQVTHSTVLGLEGSTGVSTGTHLHFEIRVNGQAANPHTFIPGQP
jgi:murein DD-endopeptidase MepM/ murein hydrolase activator NlpD